MRSTSRTWTRVFTKALIALAIALMLVPPIPAGAQPAPDPNQIGTRNLYQAGNGQFAGTGQPTTPDDFGCGVSSVANCLAAMMYYIGPGLASNVAYVGAYFFSIVIQLSLNSTAYALNFLSEGWQIVRDVANMAFIFILIYLALTIMLQAETAGTVKTLAIVIVVALLVNFSFFFTRIIIDAGNILALQFYNAIPAGNVVTSTGATQPAYIHGVKDLSASIMEAVKLQSLYGSKAFDQARQACGGNSATCGLIVLTVIYLSVAAMFWMLFFAFLQVGIKFMLRIVALWFLLIASPLAFVAKTMKKTEGYFSQWWKMLFQFSVYPAIFLFMFLILTKFTSAVLGGANGSSLIRAPFNELTETGASAESIMAGIAVVAIRMGFVLALMYIALRVADWVVKEGSQVAASATGWSVGKSLGAVGAAGRGTIGWGMQRASQSATLRNAASSGGLLGRTLWRGTSALGRSSFDLRGAPGVRDGARKLTGVDVGAASNKGGFAARDAARIAGREEEAKKLVPSEGQIYKAVGSVVQSLSDEDKQKLMGAASKYAAAREQHGNNEKHADVKEAKKGYNEMLTQLGINEKIKAAKAAAGAGNANIYADAISTKDWRNLWGAASGIPFVLSKADLEAATRIRGMKDDASRINEFFKASGVKPAPSASTAPGAAAAATAASSSATRPESTAVVPAARPANDNTPAPAPAVAAAATAQREPQFDGPAVDLHKQPDGSYAPYRPPQQAPAAAVAGSDDSTPPPRPSAPAAAAAAPAPAQSITVTAVSVPKPMSQIQPPAKGTVELSSEDRALFKKTIKALKHSAEATSQGLADLGARIASSGPGAPANDNKPPSPPSSPALRPANDNTPPPFVTPPPISGAAPLPKDDDQKAA